MKKLVAIVLCMLAIFVPVVVLNVHAADLSDEKRSAIINNCDIIKDNLKDLQHRDSRIRVYLGKHYEKIESKLIKPLNVRLLDNNLFDEKLMNNQNDLTKARTNFVIDYIEYQKVLENLVAMNCKTEPEKFYEKLEDARLKRGIVSKDVAKLKSLAEEQIGLVNALKGTL